MNRTNFLSILFLAFMILASAALLGVSGYGRWQIDQPGYTYGGSDLTARIDLIIFASIWTVISSIVFLVIVIIRMKKPSPGGKDTPPVGPSVVYLIWLVVTTALWLLASILFRKEMSNVGYGDKSNQRTMMHAIEIISWEEALRCIISILINLKRMKNASPREPAYTPMGYAHPPQYNSA